MKKIISSLISFSLLAIVLFNTGCSKSASTVPALDVVDLYPVATNVTTTSAKVYIVLNATGDATIAGAGVCYSTTNKTPTLSDTKLARTIDTISYASNITGLSPNTTYYVRGYITNGAGTAYSDVVTFKTNSVTAATTAAVSTFAGTGTGGFVNGSGLTSSFNSPQGICTDASGNLYVADSFNSVIRKITPAGVTTTYAGTGTSGYADGPAATALFYAPRAVTADAAGNIYVADYGNNMIRKISTTGTVSTLAGSGIAGYADATGTAAMFRSPCGVAVDASGNVYVADKGNNVIRAITPAGVVTTLAGNATAGQYDATGTAAYFNAPIGIAINAAGTLYVADANNYAIRKVTSAGVVTTLAGNYILKTTLFTISNICLDTAGDIFIVDPTGQILEINTQNILLSLAGNVSTYGFVNGTNTTAQFNGPTGIAVNSSGNLFVTDYYNNMIRKIAVTTTP
jgi:streptogramin lyase